MNKKKLYKGKDKKICGVCSGFANYFNMDVTLVRIICVLLALSTGLGLVGYFVAALIMEDEPTDIIDI